MRLLELHKVKIRELKRKYQMPKNLDDVLIEDNTMHPYMEVGTSKHYLPLKKTSLR